jgi:hypothetical protein
MLVTTPTRPVRVRAHTDRRQQARQWYDRLAEPIPIRWAVWGIVALVGANVAAGVLEPVPANPGAPEPWLVSVASTVAVLAMLPALGGLLAWRRWGMALSAFAAGIAVVLVAGCPLSGHHHFGLWWVGEFGGMAAWAAVSVAGLRCPPGSRRAARAAWR